MEPATSVTPELYEKYKSFFPHREIPADTLEKVEYINPLLYTFSKPVLREVPIKKIVGTWREQYSIKYGHRWIDLVDGKLRGSSTPHYQPAAIKEILSLPFENVSLAHIAETDKYYIIGDGSHRITFHKLSGEKSLHIEVEEATLKPPAPLPKPVHIITDPGPDRFLDFCCWVMNLFSRRN